MVVAFSPVTASKHIKEKYYRYLKTTFKMGEPYKKEYEALLENQDAFAKGPYEAIAERPPPAALDYDNDGGNDPRKHL